MTNIRDKDISIVLQGPVYKDITNKVAARMREIFPEAEIILSTWEGSDVENIICDTLVLNKDPGGTPLFLDKSQTKTNNVDRMIVSSKNGIKRATRKYCLRWRTDLLLKNNEFLQYFDAYDKRADEWKVFEKRVLVHYATLPFIYPLGPTDISCFGLTKDVLLYWDLPTQTKEDAYYFMHHEYPKDALLVAQQIVPKRGAEMYIWYNVLKKFEDKYGIIKSDYGFDFNEDILRLSELSIVNNLQILSREKFDFEALAHPYLLTCVDTAITEDLWLYYYKKYCVKKIPFWDLNFHVYWPFKILKYKFKYILPLKKSLKKLSRFSFGTAYRLYRQYVKGFYR